jgi:hypothetical protein
MEAQRLEHRRAREETSVPFHGLGKNSMAMRREIVGRERAADARAWHNLRNSGREAPE